MAETKDSNTRGRSTAKILVILTACTLGACALALGIGYLVFNWAMETLLIQPAQTFVDWVGMIEVEDHGGDLRITLPPTEGSETGRTAP